MRIYDSQGNEITSGSDERTRVAGFAKAGLRFAVKKTGRSDVELILFFRAKESEYGRSNLFYAMDRRELGDLSLEEFMSAVEETAEHVDLSVDESAENMSVYRKLGSLTRMQAADDARLTHALDQLSRRQKLRFGVRNAESALAHLKTVLIEKGVSTAICDSNPTARVMRDYQVVFKTGARSDLEPIGDTEEVVNEGRKQFEGSVLDEAVANIRSEIQSIKRQTDLDDARIRRRVHKDVPTLKPPRSESERSGTSGRTGSSTSRSASESRLDRIPTGVLVGIMIGAAAIVVVSMLSMFGPSPLALVGDLGSALDGGTNDYTLANSSLEATDDEIALEGQISASGPQAEINGDVILTLRPIGEGLIGKTKESVAAGKFNGTITPNRTLSSGQDYIITVQYSRTQFVVLTSVTKIGTKNFTHDPSSAGNSSDATPTPTPTPTPAPTSPTSDGGNTTTTAVPTAESTLSGN